MRWIPALVLLASTATAHADADKKAVEKVVKAQVAALFAYDDTPGPYADGAKFTTSVAEDGMLDAKGLRASLEKYIVNWGYVQKTKIANLKVSLGDAGGAWASFTVHVTMVEDEMGDAPATFDLRATEVLDTDDAGTWAVGAGHWSKPVPDKAAKAMATKGDIGTLAALADADTDQSDIASFLDPLRGHTIADSVSPRADVVAYGTDATKPRVGGKKTQKAWKAWWKAVSVDGAIAGDCTASVCWLAANVGIAKGKVTIPARVFLVLAAEKGYVKVMGAQLSVPSPLPYSGH